MALNGQVAVVTGAAMGIGRAITEILLQNGAKVALIDVDEIAGRSLLEILEKQFGSDRVLFLSCDVESEEKLKVAFQKIAETFGGVDIFCNNAGILNEIQWQKTISINLVSAISGNYLALEHMSRQNGGRGGIGPLPSCPVYTASKHGLLGFTRAMAAASRASGYGVRVNALCPSFVQTELFSSGPSRLGQFAHLADEAAQFAEKIGILTVGEVAEAFLELATDETKNGEALLLLPKRKQYVTFPSFL
ncbi:15-hydroxyprostaglandin dehydrogenase [NAD(+)] [Takifugu flavidus]|uniref:15-hydroxyprostaglandin dehydrogenase [NAD(+)] n=1 Tax=Takifugu flavidus TaxID=433684 RepID=A0A5C6P5U2_9TELE|nr:15-hydroxyprostaglandin dehydrogenase [NAD(+)] [Takifugu flavidus]